ncbi:unnamed protein product [Rotaria sordida]|uniref:Uncharacterized protein n=3 Tax=Rotaria sordida TaxID=392033 RepID=A0A814NLB4_9BILA|nr:unnamed protein product [Rotaria sordida]
MIILIKNMTNNLDDINMNFIYDYCQQMTKQLLELAQKFARKSRRSSTKLTCNDLINAFECMNILYKQKIVQNEEHFLRNSFDQMFEIEYK